MGYAHVQTSKQDPTTPTSVGPATSISETFAATPTVGNLVLIFLSTNIDNQGTIASITDNQGGGFNTWTVGPGGTAFNAACWLAYCVLNKATSTFTITVNFTAQLFATIGISEFSGNPPSIVGIFDGNSIKKGTGTTENGGTVVPLQAGDLFIAVATDTDGNQTGATAPAGYTTRALQPNGNVALPLYSASLIEAGTASHDSAWAVPNVANWLALTAAFGLTAPVVGGVPLPRGPAMRMAPTPISGFRSAQAFIGPPPPPPPGSTSFPPNFTSRTFGPSSPVSRFRSLANYVPPPLNPGSVPWIPLEPAWFARPQWNPERTEADRAAWTQALWAVPPQQIPAPVSPERVLRPAWNPERSQNLSIPYQPPTIGPAVVGPDRFARPPWDPERTWTARAAWTQALWAVPPQQIPPPVLPERYLAPWNPERTEADRAAWTQALWAVPPQQIPEPVLPPHLMRPIWIPERSHTSAIALIIPPSGVSVLLPDRFPVRDLERSLLSAPPRLVVPVPLLSWTPALLDRYVQALRSNPWLDLFLPVFPQPNPAVSQLIVLVGRQDATATSGQQDALALRGQQAPAGVQGSQDEIVILGRQDTGPLSGSQ